MTLKEKIEKRIKELEKEKVEINKKTTKIEVVVYPDFIINELKKIIE